METAKSVMFASSEVKIRGEYIEARPYAWGRTVKAARPLAAVLRAGVENVKYANDVIYNLNHQNYEVFTHQLAVILSDIMEEAGDELIQLLRLSVNKSSEWIKSLTLQEFCDLLVEVYKVNEPFFKRLFVKEAAEEKQKPKQDSLTAEQAAALLVEYGHAYQDVLDLYSPEQVMLFLERIVERELYKKADNAEAVLLGIGGSFTSKPEKITGLLQQMKGGVRHGK